MVLTHEMAGSIPPTVTKEINMTGDRNDKMSELMRAIRWGWDCMKPISIKGSEKRRLRRKRRHDAKREIAP